MTSPLISCVVPVYNGARFLAEALDSILTQDYPLLEVLVVDDGSTDETASVTAGFGERIRRIWQENAGPAAARNRGIAEARGAFVAFLDSDDRWRPAKLSQQYARFAARPGLGICITHLKNFWMAEVEPEEQAFRDHPRGQPIAGYSTVTMMVNRTVFEQVGTFNPGLKHGDDTDWFLRAEAAGISLEIVPEVLVDRRLHGGNRSRQWAARSRDEYLNLVKARLDRRRLGGTSA